MATSKKVSRHQLFQVRATNYIGSTTVVEEWVAAVSVDEALVKMRTWVKKYRGWTAPDILFVTLDTERRLLV